MKITSIEPQKRNKDRFSIYIDDKFYMGVNQDVVLKHFLTKGMEVDEEFLNDVIKTEEKKQLILPVTILDLNQEVKKKLEIN